MIPNFTEKHATLPETSLLRFIFAYIEFIDLKEPVYKTGRPRISRKIMLKCFLLQAYFGIASLRKLVDFLKADSYWRCTAGLSDVPHFSTFSRAATWLRTEGFSLIHQQILSDLDVKHTPLALIDSTALRSSIYDQQAKWGMSTRHKWYKGYKLHLATTPTGIILAQELTTANVYDSDAVSDLLSQLTDFNIQMMIGDTAYDSKKVRKQSEEYGIMFLSPINPRKGGQRKDPFGRIMPHIFKTTFGRLLLGYRRKIEHVFCCLKNKLSLEQPRWYGKNRYYFHCQLCVFIHNIGFLC